MFWQLRYVNACNKIATELARACYVAAYRLHELLNN